MNFYEITNGWTGESYVRVYVWAQDEAQAIELARESFKRKAESEYRVLESKWDTSRFHVEKLVSSDSEAFASKPSDSGFERWED